MVPGAQHAGGRAAQMVLAHGGAACGGAEMHGLSVDMARLVVR